MDKRLLTVLDVFALQHLQYQDLVQQQNMVLEQRLTGTHTAQLSSAVTAVGWPDTMRLMLDGVCRPAFTSQLAEIRRAEAFPTLPDATNGVLAWKPQTVSLIVRRNLRRRDTDIQFTTFQKRSNSF